MSQPELPAREVPRKGRRWPLYVLLGVLVAIPSIGIATGNGGPVSGGSATTTVGIAAAPGVPPSPDAMSARAYINELNAIDPDIVHGKIDKAIDRGRNQCASIAETTDQVRLLHLVQERFTSPNHPDGFDNKIAAEILAAVRKHICP